MQKNNFQNILYECSDHIAKIIINRPPFNILDIETMKEINLAIEDAKVKEGLKLLIFDSLRGKAFSSGVDVRDHTPDKMDEMIEVFHKIFRLLMTCDIPTLCVAHGMALGGGFELVSFCDMVIASERAVFGQPEIKIGLYPSMAVAWLHKITGPKKAYEMLLTGDSIDAAEAEKMGLVNKVVPHEELDQAVEKFVKRVTDKSSVSLKWAKTAIRQGLDVDFEKGLKISEIIYKNSLMKTEDANEGMLSFMEKRKPIWKEK